MHLDLVELIRSIGYLGVFAIVFAESGLFFGFFLPGDSLLFTAGFIASQGLLSLPILLIGCFVAAVLGDNIGYTFGHRVGRKFFENLQESFWFKKSYLTKTEEFYAKHGAQTIILARFIPIVRTFAPIVAGIASMNYSKFLSFNIIGGICWAIGVTSAGYFLGTMVPNAHKYLLPIVAGIIVLSIVPPIIEILRNARKG